ncbi:hypothetical protein QFZ23_004784 [Arthrobacter globiformis]|uniref:nuclear transport factor 2 family protein n=1 Tax=Arthrobacter globiformis TaxID=1665 RepID=UPI0027810218|nr:nuclear transport factor 2 family protein [Arthrobacter globiformis]MDQ1060819.1 hypothetical protein [Arthrobacter globiformis]
MTQVPLSAAGTLPAAEHRHLIENALALYCLAMDEHDATAAGHLLTDAQLHFKDQPLQTGADAIAGFYAGAFTNPAPTRHLITNLLTQTDGPDITYRATYQRWSLAGTHPACQAIGEYRGRFTPTPERLKWTEHRILQA